MKTISIKDIVNNNFCTGCGACISESNSKMIWNKEGFLVPDISKEFSDQAIKLCPFNPSPQHEIQDEDQLADLFFKESKNNDKRIAHYQNTYVGHAVEYRHDSSSGGIATYIFATLLKNKIVDHLFIVKEVNGTYQYQWFDSVESIKLISKTRYLPVTMENLFKEISSKEGKVAVSGVACFIKAIRLKQHYDPQFKEKIAFTVGIICGGLKSRFFTDYLADKAGINGKYNKQQYRIKDPVSTASDYSFGAFSDDQSFHQIKMRTVGDMWGTGLFKSNACDFCDDVTTELADISLGDAWLSPYNKDGKGTSVIVSRSLLADELMTKGIESGALKCQHLALDKFLQSQEGSFKHRQLGIRYRLNLIHKKSRFVPFKRAKFFQDIPFEYRNVQRLRMKLRAASLEAWENTKNAEAFEKEIDPVKNQLIQSTRFYHRIQKLRRILKLKTL
ncbi:Coenzyme F420 hydrogenase/dehydrogenase, beta subunit C-terminal domain [Epilithonimonas hominis]|uniref:Coenzyme F420 hydrogenase/dehydrogenase, beta subunit C-terminal domain n=1 Tax=Epilithonimonas hominis TaxID=420404 RepID=UPI000EF00D8D|nr:Coenzyme F420 hydrogenase/dehydrogenase, beta subunit C-terminal domain [Epilithonimonas hominis]HAP96717.1 hypothetical protein [Chryseobacterium sp.]